MAKQLNVNLAFTADTGKAKAQLQDLQRSLEHLSNTTISNSFSFNLTKDLQEAANAAMQLKVQLENAVDVNTGNLDLTKFNESMAKSGMSLEKYQNQLYQLGPAGEKAFTDLARSITLAEVPLRRNNRLVSELWTTLKNTARWQLSSSVLHGFMGAVQSAYGYAQDLNESLNNIRIVTGYGAEEMARFAEQANQAAKALSTTTTEYTNASLIYYQQGLSAEEVQKRTDITVKMANVARQSAKVVSDQMTAVWNNFYDGTKSLEYYADVMTALGAKTASSTDEIAGGLEKFAAIGDTIGLSYEYAASALATITSNTRQSEEVVGTALKTIFARIQGLNLGETLDDGVTLNKYSEALAKVGISIFDQSGELKKMDTILDEMGSKWNDLNSAQQTALAQTIAGVRQYTQLVALMENWNSGDSDSFQANLETTATAEGALQEQADIYAESWEAASARVQAAAQDVYDSLLNEDFFIGFNNGLATVLDGVSSLIDGMGGMKGVLLAIGTIMTRVFNQQIAQGLSNAAYSLKMLTPSGRQSEEKLKLEANQRVIDAAKDSATTSGGYQAEAYTEQAKNQISYLENAKKMTIEEQKVNQQILDRNKLLADEVIKSGQILEEVERKIQTEKKSLQIQAQLAAQNNKKSSVHGTPAQLGNAVKKQQQDVERLGKSYSTITELSGLFATKTVQGLKGGTQEFNNFSAQIQDVIKELTGLKSLNPDQDFTELAQALSISEDEAKSFLSTLSNASSIRELDVAIDNLVTSCGVASDQAIVKLRNALVNCTGSVDQADALMEDYLASIREFGPASVQAVDSLNKLKAAITAHNKEMEKTAAKPIQLSQAITTAASVMMAFGQVLSQIQGIMQVWNNEEATTSEKITALITGIGMLVPAAMSIIPAFSGASVGVTLFGQSAAAAGTIASLSMWQLTLIVMAVTAAIAAVVAIVKVCSDAYNADAIAAEKAAKAAKDLAESHEEAKQTLEDLQSAFGQYDEAVAALEACTEGTEEWNTALQKVNETVLNLMNEYPHLLKDADVFTRNEITGMLELNRKKQQEILDELEKQVSITQAASLFGAANASKAQVKSNKTDLTRAVGQSYAVGTAHSYGQGTVVYDDYLNVGKILTDNAIELADLTEIEYRQKVSDLLRNAANDQAKNSTNFNSQIDNLVNQCVDYQNQINNLADSTEAAANQMMNVAQLIADQNLGDEFDAAEKTIAGKNLAERENELYEQYYKKMTGSGISKASGADNEIYKDMAEKLANATGDKFAALTKGNAVTGSDGNRKLVFYNNETGKRESYDAEWVAQQIAAAEALKELSGSAKEAQNTLSTMDDQIRNISSGSAAESQSNIIRSFIADSNFDSGNKKDFSALSAEVAEQGGAEAYIKAVFGQNGEFTDDMAQKYGYDTAAEFIDAFNTKLADMESAWDTIELPADLLGTGELSFTAAKALHDVFYDINIGPLGERAGKQFTEGLNKMIKSVKAEDQAAALKALTNIDWSSWDALDQADLVMQQFGVDIDTASSEWVSFAHNMRLATNATPDYSNLKQTLMDVTAIISDLDFGSIIEDEDYEKLIKYNDAWKEFFILQADGSRKFIGDSEDMMAQTRARIIEDRKTLQERQKVQSEWKTVVWGHDGKLADWGAKSGSETGTARNLMNAGGKTEAMLELLGYTDKRIQEMLIDAENADAAIKQAGQDAIEKMYRAMANFTEENLVQAEVDLNEMMASTAVNLIELQALLASNQISAEAYDKQLHYLIESQVEATESLSELKDLMGSLQSAGESMDYETYAENLIRLAKEYDNCTKEIKEYKRALANGDSIDEAKDILEASLMLAEAAEEYNLEAKELEVQSHQLAKAYNLTAVAAAKLAIQNQRMNKGIVTLAENWEEWKKALTDSDTTTTDFANALIDCTAAVADLVGASADLELPDDFFNAERLALLEQAINGDINAINQLGFSVAETQIKALEFNAAFASLSQMMDPMGDIAYDEQSFDNDMQLITNCLEELRTRTEQTSTEMGQEWVDALNHMAKATGMSVDEMNQLLGTMGVQAKVDVEYVKQPMEIPTYTEHVEKTEGVDTDGDGVDDKFGYYRYTVPGEPITVEGYAAVAQISTEDNPLAVDVNEGSKPSGGGPGGGSGATWTPNRGPISDSTKEAVKMAKEKDTSKPADKVKVTKKDDIVDRYKEWDDALDDVADAMEDVNKQADRLYGANRINALKKQNELLLKQKELLTKKKGDVETDLKSDKNSLVNIAKVHGVNFKFDAQGNISNYTAEMTKLYNELAAVEATWADASKHASKDAQDAYEENVVQPIRDKIDEIKETLGIYTDTRELIEDLQNQIDDAFYEWQDNNYEQIHYKLELELEINDTELRMIDYYLNKIADDFYSMGEAAAKISTEKVDTLVNSLKDYESFENELHAKFDAGDISQEKYVEGLKETFNGYLDNLEALQDLDKEMQHYYEDTLSAGAEELAIYTDRMEHLTSVLDHYQNIVTMMNGEMDFDNIGTILEGKASTLNNEMKIAESNYAMLKAEQAAMQAAYDAADAEGKKYLKSSLDAINAQVDEAHEAMLSKTEEWAEAQRAIMENAMKKAAHEMEMAFTNNMGFDMVNNSLERLSSYSDEYLTKTNQIYETQKLMNTAQQAIDKTTNQAAKIRLENYNKEIKSLQDKNKLSKLELEIAEAKYDVLLAEIALEEAQKAKATVRLQRDSEGNYGYVYTADKESISAAEQDLADAQNALYNIGLEGANDYGQKLLDLQQKLADDLIALEEARAAGQYQTDEEYYAAKNRLISEYNNLFTAYSEQYTTALGIDASIQQEAWITAYDNMITKTEDWQIHVDEYTTLCEESYSHWREIVQAESDIVTELLGNVSSSVKNVTDESNNLKDKIVKEVIPAIENEYVQVRTAVLAYENLRAGLQLTIQRYEELAAAIQETMRQQALLEGQTNTPEVPGIPEEEAPSEESDNKIGHSEMMDLVEDIMVHGSYANDPARTQKILDAGYSAEDRTAAQMIINDIAKNESAAWRTGKDWDKVLNEYTTKYGYNTGGYTGEWGPEGRLAVLHQKELILNASDTQNFLIATEILRSIADIIDINSLHSQISQLTPVGMTTSGQQTLEQAVSIEAHFPNVTDRNEIEEAFNNLINTASQYANRKF